MLKCATCGTLIQDGETVCGVCGSTRLLGTEQILQSSGSAISPPLRPSRSLAIFVLTVSVALVAGGSTIVVLWLNSALLILGIFMLLFGLVFLLGAVGGPGGGARGYIAARRAKSQRLGTELGQKDREGNDENQPD